MFTGDKCPHCGEEMLQRRKVQMEVEYLEFRDSVWQAVGRDEIGDAVDGTVVCFACEKFVGTAREGSWGDDGDIAFFADPAFALVEIEELFVDIAEKIKRINEIWKGVG